jgi:hypothetical protein
MRLHNSLFRDSVQCDIWSSWQGMGVSPMSALVSISCAALSSAGRFRLVVCAEIHRGRQQVRPFCSCLGLFAPVHAQDVQIRSAAHRMLSPALLFLEQYHNNIILMLQVRVGPYDSDSESLTTRIVQDDPGLVASTTCHGILPRRALNLNQSLCRPRRNAS